MALRVMAATTSHVHCGPCCPLLWSFCLLRLPSRSSKTGFATDWTPWYDRSRVRPSALKGAGWGENRMLRACSILLVPLLMRFISPIKRTDFRSKTDIVK